MQVKCKSKADTVCNADITNGGITMENYFLHEIAKATQKVNEYANHPGVEATNQWYYWMGRRDAYQAALEQFQSKNTITV